MTSDALTRAEARQRAGLLSAVRYRVELDLTGDAGTFASTTEVAFSCSRPGASTFIDLDAAAVDRMELNGSPLPAEAFTGRRIRLEPLAAHNVLRVAATCRYQRSGVGLHRFTDPLDGRVYLHTQFESFHAHQVYACFDQPDLKAPFTLQVRAPADWRVISNSPALQRPEAGVWRFAPTLPVPTYITALVAGPFHAVHERHHDIDLGVYCRQSLAAHLDSEEILEITRQGLDYFEQAFDYPYPFGQGGGPPGPNQG
ncbi:MAG TPA: hypothetical protein VG452_11485, partial [Egibacteraceae bacterium]|nr:hypothetical protein [Egibacteraceae bacterium]